MARNPRLDYSCKHSVHILADDDKNAENIADAMKDWVHWKGKIVSKASAYCNPRLVGIVTDILYKIKDGTCKPVAEVKWFNHPTKKNKTTMALSTLYDVKAYARCGYNTSWYGDDNALLKIVDKYYNGV